MPATIVQSKAAAQNTALATVGATFDSAATAGNLLVLVVAADAYAPSPPSGWTQSTGCEQETFLGHYVWWKVAAGGETSVSYTLGSAGPSCWITAEISGLDASPFDVSNGQFQQAAGTSYTTPTITPTSGDRLLLAAMGYSLNNAFTSVDSWLNSFTEIVDVHTTLGSGTRDQTGLAYREVTADGVTGYSSGATSTASGTPQSRTGIILAFKVASGGGPTPISVADTGSAADALSVNAATALTEAPSAADTLTTPARTLPIADAGAGTEALAAAATVGLTDAGSASDALSNGTGTPKPIGDTGAAADALTVAATAGIADAGSAGQTFTGSATAALADSASATETLATVAAVSLAEAGTAVQALTAAVTLLFTDVGSGSDAATGSDDSNITRSLADAGSGSESLRARRITLRPNAGTTARPYAGITLRP